MAEKILFQTKLTEFDTFDKETKGVVRRDEFGNVYKWVQNGEASTVTATLNGAACYEGTDKKTAHIPTTAYLAALAGFWQAAVPGQSFGWIRCSGSGDVALAVQSATKAAFGVALIPANGVETLATSAAVTLLYAEATIPVAIAIQTVTTTVNAIHNCRL